MPLYDFKCEKCGYVFEEITSYEGKCVCPKCGGKTVRLLSSSFGIKFIGSGFHNTDYK